MRLLIVDDEVNMTKALKISLKPAGYHVDTFQSPQKALTWFTENGADMILTDMKMPGMDGISFVKEIRKIDTEIPIIMMTAYATVETAVQAMKEGAYDYILKPFDPEELKLILEKAGKMLRLIRENQELRNSATRSYVGDSQETIQMLELVEQVAATNATVLVRGESGTGKEVVAQLIHQLSARKKGPFIKMNCSAIPENLLESELFGHVKGSFTGAVKDRLGKFHLADGGTIFLDEIGDMSPSLQTKLLRVIQEQQFEQVGGSRTIQVDVRIIAATHRNLEEAIETGEFREDLFYRLNVFPITILPLRRRPKDIIPLVEHFKNQFSREMAKPITTTTEQFLQGLTDYKWPGNIRELSNFMERVIILCKNGVLDADLLIHLQKRGKTKSSNNPITLEALEKEQIRSILEKTEGNKAKAAELLGIDRSTLYRMIKRHSIEVDGE